MTDCGGRPARAEAAILDAVLSELAAHGFAGLTVEGVAAAACVGRATIYRHWGSRAALVMDAFHRVAMSRELPDTGSVRGDLVAQASGLAHALAATPVGSLFPVLVEASRRDPELAALQHQLIDARRADAIALIERGVERGELAPDVDRELLLDLVVAPIFYRSLLLHRATTPEEVGRIVDTALAGADPGTRWEAPGV